jgi:hypothetical protein
MTASDLHLKVAQWLSGDKATESLIIDLRTACQSFNLPAKYSMALEGVLERLESSSLFTEESCSFSKKDLGLALDVWIDKACLAFSETKT